MIHQLTNDKLAEDTILGLCIFNGYDYFTIANAYITTPEIFYNEDNRTIWKVMCSLYENATPIDAIIVNTTLRKGGPSFGGDSWAYLIAEKMNYNVSGSNLMHYCIAIVEDYMSRISTELIYSLKSKDNAIELAKELDQKLKKATNFKTINDWIDLSQAQLELTQRRDNIAKGITTSVLTGFRDFDMLTGGLEAGFIAIAARSSMGKTAFACSLIVSMANSGSPVGIISLEMPNVQITARLTSILSGVEFWRIFRNKHTDEHEESKVEKEMLESTKLKIFMNDSSKVSLSDIRYKSERLVKSQGAKCIIIDYLQLIDTSGAKNETREREVAKLSAGLKSLSKELNIPIIALCALNRESETPDKVSKPGKLSQLRESDAILYAIDMGIIIDRPFKRGVTVDENNQSTETQAFCTIEKYRNGETRSIEMYFEPTTMAFKDKGYVKPEPTEIQPQLYSNPSAGITKNTAPKIALNNEGLPF